MTCRPGDLVLVPVSYTDLSSIKQRPVLVLTLPDGRGDFVGLPVTSRPQGETGLLIEPTALISGDLSRRSWIRTDHPVSLNSRLVLRIIAQVAEPLRVDAINHLCRWLNAGP